MSSSSIELEQNLDKRAIEFNKQRITALLELTLQDLFFFDSVLFAINNSGITSQLISRMLQDKLFDVEKQLLNDLFSDHQENISLVIEKIRQHDKNFQIELIRVNNRFTLEFASRFCDSNGDIDWAKLVEFNSGNYDLNKFLP